ncbi:MAG: tetratricopeptide repeat protein [Verrucomicrobiota bacterium]
MQNKSPQALYYLALAHLGNNDAPKASKSLAQAITLNPNFLEASLLQAELDIRRGAPALAIPALTKIVQQQPQLFQAHLLLANAYLSQKKTDQAVAVFNQLMTLFPKNAQVPLLLGTVLMEQNKTMEARKAFEKSRALAPDYSLALERLVDLDLLDKQYPAAKERVKKQMRDYPTSPDPWLLLAKIHLAQKETTEAETALLKVIELDVNQRNAYLLLAQIYSTSDRQQQALAKLNSLVANKTNDIGAWMQIGMIHDRMKNYAAAREAYEKLLAINPDFSPALNNVAYIYSEHQKDFDKAFKAASRARQLLPNDPYSGDTLGWILYKRGDYHRALGLLSESAQKLPAEPEIQFHLGMTHYMLGDVAAAQIALQKAVGDSREFLGKDAAKRSLVTLAMVPKNVDSATLKDLEKTLQNQPDDPIVLNILTTVYERNGQIEKAVESCQAALARNPKNVPAMLELIRFYSGSLKEPKKALDLAKEAHNLAPDDAHVSHLLGQLVYKSGDYQWSSSLFQEAARKLPNDPQLGYDLAWAEYNLGSVAEAIAQMENVAQSGNEPSRQADAQRFLTLVRATQSPERLKSASTQASEILKTDSNYLPALMVSALLLEQQNKPAEAKRIYDQILSRNPAFLPAARNATLLAAQSSVEDPKAYELATRVRAAYSGDPAVARALGILAYRKGDFVRSAQLLKESSSKFQADGEFSYYLGMAHYRLKQPKESKAALQHALSLNLPGKFADEANRILTELK